MSKLRLSPWIQILIAAAVAGAFLLYRHFDHGQIDTPRLERQIENWAAKQSSGVTGINADCPDDISIEAGRDFHCLLTDDQGDAYRVTVTIENSDGDVTWITG